MRKAKEGFSSFMFSKAPVRIAASFIHQQLTLLSQALVAFGPICEIEAGSSNSLAIHI